MTPAIIRLSRLWHVGAFDPSGKRSGSYEGAGLSVSTHPAAWRIIGEGQVSGDTWTLVRRNARFLDALALDEAFRSTVLDWGVVHGYAQEAPLWRWTYWDDDLEDEVHQTFESEAEAIHESGDDDDPSVERVDGHVSTLLLDAETLQTTRSVGTRNVLDLLLPIYAERELDLDGVWWSEDLSPLTYSAPRGVIPANRVDLWKRTRCPQDPDHLDY